MGNWDNLSLTEKAAMIRVAVKNGITNLQDIKREYNEFAEGGDTVGEWVDAIYQNNPQEESLGEPEHHYDFTQSEEWANAHGYYPDARGHRDDRVKKPAHPSHPSRGTWERDKFVLSELGMQNPNYTLFGLNDGGQDHQAILTYQGGSVIPEITVTPNGNYIYNPYDNIKLKYSGEGNIYKKGGNKNDYSKAAFLQSLDQSLKEDNRFSSNEFKRFFTELADMESGYRPAVTNSIGAKGYFQLMPSNRSASWSNPTQQFHEMYKLVGNNLDYLNKHLTKEDWERASQLGIDTYGLLAGAHLGGVGNVVKALRGKGNAKDMNGSSVMGYMTKFSQNGASRPITVGDVSIPMIQDIPEFIPLNSQAFNTTLPTYQRPELTLEESVIQETPVSPYSPEEIDRQERMNRLSAFNRILGLTNPYPQEDNSFLSTIGLLTGNTFSKGGDIHIKPSHKGRLTELKKRTGKSEAELYKTGGPAVRKMITFARNARKWKHGLGGNLFSGEENHSQQMDNSYTYYKPLDNIFVDSEGNLLDPSVPSARGSIRTPDVIVTANPIDVGRGKAARLYNDYGIASNDATSTPLTRNIHLNERGLDGATKAAAWMQDHPTLNNVGMALGAVPIAVAGYPAFMAAGEGAATALANPYVDAGLTSYFGAHGLNHAINEGIDGWADAAMTAMELTPLGRLAKPVWNTAKNNAKAFYNNLTMDLTSTPGTYYVGYPKRDISILMPGKTGGIFLTPDKKFARGYTGAFGTGKVYETKVNFGENPVHIDAKGRYFDMIAEQDVLDAFNTTAEEMKELGLKPFYTKKGLFSKKPPQRYYHIDDISAFGKKKGASSLIVDNVFDQGPGIFGFGTKGAGQQVIVYSPEQISLLKGSHPMKSAPQITAENASKITPQITAENAAKNSSIMADANDFSYKGLTSNMSDFFEKMIYNNKIHGKPMVPSDEGVGGFSKSVQVGIPKTEYDELLHDVIDRNIREFKRAGLSDAQVSNYINDAKDAMDNVHIGMYSDSDYIKGGWEGFGGFYDSEGNFISVNTGSPLQKTKVVKHEGRHLLDHKVDDEILMPASENFGKDFDSDIALSTMQKVKQNQNMILYDAYDNDFMTLPSKEGFNEGLEGYSNMDREAITTNLDSRNELLGSKADWDLDITDKIIDKMPDNAIFDAVEKANGYGRRYIKFLRDNNKLTPQKAQQFREAMKHVGAYAIPTAIAAGTLYGKQE